MNHYTRFLLFFFIVFSHVQLSAQSMAIGDWREHLPYNNCIAVSEAGSLIYTATPYGIFTYDRSDNSIQRLTKINGLSDIGLSDIAWNSARKTLVITYTNANIDLLKDNKITNLSDIKRKPILGDKNIYSIVCLDKYAYLCCGFGIVVVDLEKEEIKDTYYLGPEGSPLAVYDLTNDGSNFYAATASGVYSADMNASNLSNYASWTHDESLPGPNKKYNTIAWFKGNLIVNRSAEVYNTDTMFIHTASGWDYLEKTNSSTRIEIKAFGDLLVFVNVDYIDIKDANLNMVQHLYSYNLDDTMYAPQPHSAIISQDGHLWIADQSEGLIENYDTWGYNRVLPNGPSGVEVFDMSIAGGKLSAVPGGRNLSWGGNYDLGALYSFEGETWKSVDNKTSYGIDTIRDILTVAVDPTDPKRSYAGSWGYGLVEFYDGTVKNVFNGTNSSLQSPVGYQPWNVWIGGLVFDEFNNLWVTNSSAPHILSVRLYPGMQWKSIDVGNLYPGAEGKDMGEIIIDQLNQKWVLLRGNSLLVYSDNYTPDKAEDDRAKILTSASGQGSIPGSRVLSIACDKEGQVWLGTDEGVAVFYSPENVFSGQNFDAQRVYITIDGYTQYLLETEAVTAIAVDGANRKWFGTDRAGAFLMSADGSKQILHFTAEDSPLLSNNISSITIDPESGEVFFGTDKGIVSYKGTATEGGETNADVLVYPNPVQPGYEGLIAVKGLVTNANVKITDISGGLIYQTTAEGGQATWNGRNFDGRKAGTGVYLVFITNEDGSETFVSKILFLN
jgi:hypothetical protein